MRPIDYRRRLRALRDELEKRRLDSFLITADTNISYLSGFKGHDASLLITRGNNYFITDSRYVEEAKEDVKGFGIKLVEHSMYETLEALIKKGRLKRIGFESMNLPYEVAHRLKRLIPGSSLVAVKGAIENMRAIKDDVEITLIKKSIGLAKDVFKRMLAFVRPGISEELLKYKIELDFIKNGARAGFEPIIASGQNSSKPHARTTQDRIKKNDFVMIDMGCSLKGYNSDLTRMIILGKVSDKFKKIYNIVRKAQRIAIDLVGPGVRLAEVDRAARGYIKSNGFGKYFGHALGHGVGLEVHERPSISPFSEAQFKKGMVVTVEPAIYIPGFGGVRIEDMVLVTDNGCETLTG